jgi:hypothetical protein
MPRVAATLKTPQACLTLRCIFSKASRAPFVQTGFPGAAIWRAEATQTTASLHALSLAALLRLGSAPGTARSTPARFPSVARPRQHAQCCFKLHPLVNHRQG